MRLPRRALTLFAALLAFVLVPACGGDDDGDTTGPDDEEFQALVGTWMASSAVFTNSDDPSESFDVVAAGATIQIEVTSDHTYTITSTVPGEGTETESGEIDVEGGQVVLTFDDDGTTETERLDYTLSNNDQTLTVSFEGDDEFDFDGDGEDDPAQVEIVLQKQ